MTQRNPVIIDSDPGIDDALAIIYSSLAKIPVIGITTVHGNSGITNVTRNTLYITNYLRPRIPVYKGSSVSLEGSQYKANSSGDNGFGGFRFELSRKNKVESKNAIDFIASELKLRNGNKKIDLLCIGPLTNIAIVFNLFPHLIKNIGSIIIMGGEFTGKGNITNLAEYNAHCDPLAFREIIERVRKHNIKTVIIPANVCREVTLTTKELEKLSPSISIPSFKEAVKPYINYYLHDKRYGNNRGAVIYDLLVPFYYTNPSLFRLRRASINIHTKHGYRYGQTTLELDSKSCIKVCDQVDGEKLKKIFFKTVAVSKAESRF